MPRHPANASTPANPTDAARRRAVVRTALLVGGIAVAIYLAFLLSGVVSAGVVQT